MLEKSEEEVVIEGVDGERESEVEKKTEGEEERKSTQLSDLLSCC